MALKMWKNIKTYFFKALFFMCACVRVCVPTMKVRGQREESGPFSQHVGFHS